MASRLREISRPPSALKGFRGGVTSQVGKDFDTFIETFKQNRFLEIAEAAKAAVAKNPNKKVALKMPISKLMGWGNNSEKSLMNAFGWYWEPLLHDLAFFEEMRDSVSLIDGSVQKLVDVAMDGMKLQVEGDEDDIEDFQNMLFRDQNVNFWEVVRRSMTDLYSIGNLYMKPIMSRDDEGRMKMDVFRPIRTNAMRKLRDENLRTEGYVQLLHRPSEFILGGTPHTPTLYSANEICCGIMRSIHWYAYGKPLLASLPFVLRLKLQMERDLAEMLHQHLPRIDITFTPDDQMSDEQAAAAVDQVKGEVAKLNPTDNFVHTPDTLIEYKGPQGHALDFSMPQKHIEEQLFYVLPFAPGILGLDTRSNPYDSQQHWTLTTKIINSLRFSTRMTFAPVLDFLAQEWGFDKVDMVYSDLDPEGTQKAAEADEYHANTAIMKRDAGFIDQDTAARQGTMHHVDGPVKKAAAPGQLPPPVDPNKSVPGDTKPTTGNKVRKAGPKTDGTKTPDKDNRPKGKRHSWRHALENSENRDLLAWALAELADL